MSRLRGNKKTYAQEHKRMRIQMERLGILSNVDIGKMDVCVRRKQRLRNKKNDARKKDTNTSHFKRDRRSLRCLDVNKNTHAHGK